MEIRETLDDTFFLSVFNSGNIPRDRKIVTYCLHLTDNQSKNGSAQQEEMEWLWNCPVAYAAEWMNYRDTALEGEWLKLLILPISEAVIVNTISLKH